MESKTQKKEVKNLEISDKGATPSKVIKIGLSLDRTIDIVTDLYTRTRHRVKMLYYVERLNEFEIAQKDENLGEDERYYRGCILTIKDDNGKDFQLKNPRLIFEVVKFLGAKFEAKISEMEAEIVLP